MENLIYSDSAFPGNVIVSEDTVFIDSRYKESLTLNVGDPIKGKIPISDGSGKGFYWMTVQELLAAHANSIEIQVPTSYQVGAGTDFEILLDFIPDGYTYRTGGDYFINIDKTLQLVWGTAPNEVGEYVVEMSFEKNLGVNAEKRFVILIEVI